MKARMPWFAALASRFLGKRKPSPTKRPNTKPSWGRAGLESLERREVLSSVVAAPIASIHGQLLAPGQPTHVAVSFDSGKLIAPRSGPVYIGLDVEPAPGSSATPVIRDVVGSSGLLQFSVDKSQKAAFIIKVPVVAGKATSFTVDVASRDQNLGDFVLDAYLPGDVNGNGVVAKDDLQLIRAAYGTRAGQTKFDPAADINLDAKVGCFDLTLARSNLGAQAAVVPEWKATPAAVAPAATISAAVAPVVATPVPTTQTVTAPVTTTPVVVAPVQAQAVAPPVVYYQPVSVVPGSGQSTTWPIYAVPVQGQTYAQNGQAPIYLQSTQPAVYTQTATTIGQPAPVYYVPYGTAPTTLQQVQPVAVPPTVVVQAVGTNAPQTAKTVTASATVPQTSATPVFLYGQPFVKGPTGA